MRLRQAQRHAERQGVTLDAPEHVHYLRPQGQLRQLPGKAQAPLVFVGLAAEGRSTHPREEPQVSSELRANDAKGYGCGQCRELGTVFILWLGDNSLCRSSSQA